MIKLGFYQKLGIGLVAFIVIKSALKSRNFKPPNQKVNPKSLDPNFDYKAFALKLSNVIRGIDFTGVKARAIEELLYMNDEEFKLVYNLYNKHYAKKGNTLKTDFDGEWIWGSGINALNERFRLLNLP